METLKHKDLVSGKRFDGEFNLDLTNEEVQELRMSAIMFLDNLDNEDLIRAGMMKMAYSLKTRPDLFLNKGRIYTGMNIIDIIHIKK